MDAVIARLNAELDGCKAKNMPDDADNYVLNAANAEALVKYAGARFALEAPNTNRRSPSIDVHLMVRTLKGEKGGYEYLDAVAAALENCHLPDIPSSRLHQTAELLVNKAPSHWEYILTFEFAEY